LAFSIRHGSSIEFALERVLRVLVENEADATPDGGEPPRVSWDE